ncbi:6-hydroxymethylpterin diphosphokinase MptE-like protein [Clostridium sp. YIM B02555]|uniref:motility associated factor glycosyltransferase family protein n=1 Tax=Clostridium sp. YIM B02555 TaxID=2911968 RepID=UPI001EEDC1C9|nr:6-hydroxymethylpterin diphosphokinase MptE-like protein [Clostridium sp. YIM B02555]
MMNIEKSKSGLFTAKFNNKYIHSKYDPIKESKQFIQQNIDLITDKSNILLYGIGLGYHVNEIVDNMNNQSILYVFELNDELVKYAKEVNPRIFENNNVKIINSKFENFYNYFSEILDLTGDVIVHKGSLETIKDTNENFYNLIFDYCEVKKSMNDENLNKLLDDNFNENMSHNYNTIDEFTKKLTDNKTYIVTSAGPSLDIELELVKKYREKFRIISVGSSLRALMNNGIKPDAVVILDGKEVVKMQLVGYENEDIPLCFSSSASRWAVNAYNGPKFIFNTGKENETSIKSRGTVAVSAIDIAIKCNSKEIIFLGQDLAFIDGKSHTATFEKVYGFQDNVKNDHKNKEVRGVNGSMLPTTQGYMMFKNKIESLILENKEIKFINCSMGAKIKGTIHMSFKEYINKKVGD